MYFAKRCKKGFTLIELVLVIVVIGLITAIGGRYLLFSKEAAKYELSVKKMMTIRRAIVGDERIRCLGEVVEMGYFGDNYAFPPGEGSSNDEIPTVALEEYLPPLAQKASLSVNEYYKYDAWGNNFIYNDNYSYDFDGAGAEPSYDTVRILCYGADGAAGDGTSPFDSDFHLLIIKNLYESNLVKMNIMDKNGVILRGVPNTPGTSGTPWNHQIAIVGLLDSGGGVKFATNLSGASIFYYYQGLFSSRDDMDSNSTNWHINPIPAGIYTANVYASNGGGNNAGGIYDHRDDLISGKNLVNFGVKVLPKKPDSMNFIEIRFPGEVDINEFQ